MKKQWLNSTEVAEMLDISPVTVRRWTDKGFLECKKTAGGHRRYSLEAVKKHLEKDQPMEESLVSEGVSADTAIARSNAAEFYNRVHMANTVLKLNMSIGKTLVAIESELERVVEVLGSTNDLTTLATELERHQQVVVNDHISKVVTALQYHDLFSQRLGVVKSALEGINNVFKLSVADFDDSQRKGFSDELKRTNASVDPSVLSNFINNLLEDDKPPLNIVPSITESDSKPELFISKPQ